MNTRFKNALIALKSNKGSSVVMVIITMLFVAILGSALLFSSYMGVVIKMTEREGRQNFYEAEEVMDLVRASFQNAANDALKIAYDDVYKNFVYYNFITADANEDFVDVFGGDFKHRFLQQNLVNTSSLGVVSTTLFTGYDGATVDLLTAELLDYDRAGASQVKLNIDHLRAYVYEVMYPGYSDPTLTEAEREALLVNAPTIAHDNSDVIVNEKNKITIQNISITHTNPETSFTTTVVSDIVINVPNLAYSFTPYNVSSVPDFAFIVEDTLNSQATNVNIEGSMFAGNFASSTASNIATLDTKVSGGTVIVRDTLSVTNVSNLQIDDDVDLWVRDIVLDGTNDSNKVSIEIGGTAYVYDDLTLNDYSQTLISGDYIGYMGSDSSAGESSAIVVNNVGNELDLSNADSLTLSGKGFIGSSNYMTAESLAVNSNQRAYIIPADMFTTTTSNPSVYATGSAPTTPKLNSSYDLWSGFNLADYGLTEDSVQPVHYQWSGSNSIVYYYFNFPTEENSEKFFEDYFANKPDLIVHYLNLYLTQLSLNTVNSNTDGLMIDRDNTLTNSLIQNDQSLSSNNNHAVTFSNLTTSLSASNPSGLTGSPYDNWVKIDEIENLSDGYTNYSIGSTVAGVVVKNTDAALSNILASAGASADVKFIIMHGAANTLTIDTDFSGLIMSNGNVNITNGVTITSDGTGVRSALSAMNGGNTMGNLVEFGNAESTVSDSGSDAWDLDKIVEFSDWTKK